MIHLSGATHGCCLLRLHLLWLLQLELPMEQRRWKDLCELISDSPSAACRGEFELRARLVAAVGAVNDAELDDCAQELSQFLCAVIQRSIPRDCIPRLVAKPLRRPRGPCQLASSYRTWIRSCGGADSREADGCEADPDDLDDGDDDGAE